MHIENNQEAAEFDLDSNKEKEEEEKQDRPLEEDPERKTTNAYQVWLIWWRRSGSVDLQQLAQSFEKLHTVPAAHLAALMHACDYYECQWQNPDVVAKVRWLRDEITRTDWRLIQRDQLENQDLRATRYHDRRYYESIPVFAFCHNPLMWQLISFDEAQKWGVVDMMNNFGLPFIVDWCARSLVETKRRNQHLTPAFIGWINAIKLMCAERIERWDFSIYLTSTIRHYLANVEKASWYFLQQKKQCAASILRLFLPSNVVVHVVSPFIDL